MTHPVYRTPAWTAVRKQVLTRDAHVCQLQLRGCKNHATEVDHIVPLSQGGAPYDPTNLRAACKACNVSARNSNIATRAHHPTPSREW